MMASTSRVGVDRAPTGKAQHWPWQPPLKLHVKKPHFDTIWGRFLGVCQRQMPNFLPPPVDPLLRKFAPQIRPKMGFGAWRWRGVQWPKTVFWCSFCAAGPEIFSPPAGPLMAGEAMPCGATSVPRRVPALIATGPRDERGALVPAWGSTSAPVGSHDLCLCAGANDKTCLDTFDRPRSRCRCSRSNGRL